ncbi:phosphoketolase family protein [Nocardia niigatensis]
MNTSDWASLILSSHEFVDDNSVDQARRALDYLCAAQLYLRANPLLAEPLSRDQVKPQPRGHWGTCPPVNAVLACLGPFRQKLATASVDVQVVHGAGHAYASALAQLWLTGQLDPYGFGHTPDGLLELVRGFPHHERLGGEISPLLPSHRYMGGQLGPALAVAHGMATDAPDRLVVALIGDGECETGIAATSWLAAHAFTGTSGHGRVLPVLLLNGQRMGGPSLLAGRSPNGVARYLTGLGYQPVVTSGTDTSAVRAALYEALTNLKALDDGPSTVLVVTVPKGFGLPVGASGTTLLGTPKVHKTPLTRPQESNEFAVLRDWLLSYRPHELFTDDASPVSSVSATLGHGPAPDDPELTPPRGCLASATETATRVRTQGQDFAAAMRHTVTELHAVWGMRVYSPDELASNRVLLDAGSAAWVSEILSEEICHAWAQGYIETGRRALIVGYEGFAPVVASLITQQLTSRRLAAAASRPAMPSIVYLLTSLGWHNVISHANPGLADILAAVGDPAVHIHTPADHARTAAALTYAVRKLGRCSVILASKHPMPSHPLDSVEHELQHGWAIWPQCGDADDPELILVSAGDIAAREATAAARALTQRERPIRLRYINIHDLTCLGDPEQRPTAIPADTFTALFPAHVPVLAAVTCHPAPVHTLLGERAPGQRPDRLTVVGWRPPPRPLTHDALLRHAGMAADSLTATALALLNQPAHHQRTISHVH